MATPRIGVGGVVTGAGGSSKLQLRTVTGAGARKGDPTGGMTPAQARAEVARTKERNNIFAANLSNSLKGLHKEILGSFAAEALMVVMQETKHDSSRAAANWNISISGRNISPNLTPYAYGEAGDSWGKIGGKGSKGKYREMVIGHKRIYWGIVGENRGGIFFHPMRGGRLYSELGIGEAGNYKVELFNPILGTANPRFSGDRERQVLTGHSYAYYAFGGGDSKSYIAGLENAKEQIGNGYIPYIIKRHNDRILRDSAAGRLTRL